MYEASKVLYSVVSDREPIRGEEDNYRRVGAMKGAMLFLGLFLRPLQQNRDYAVGRKACG